MSYHSLSHHSFSDDNQLYKSGNIIQLPEIIHLTQSCISDVKARMSNNQLQLNGGGGGGGGQGGEDSAVVSASDS